MNTRTFLLMTMLALSAVSTSAANKKNPPPAAPPKTTVVVTPGPEPSTAMAMRGRPATSRLQIIGSRASQLKLQVQTLQANVARSGSAPLRMHDVEPINVVVGDLKREIVDLRAGNGASSHATGQKLCSDLELLVAQLDAAHQALATARDTPGAAAALTQMSASLDKMILQIDTLPPCCTEGICCHVGVKP